MSYDNPKTNHFTHKLKQTEAYLLCKTTSTIRGVQNLIIEHRKIERQPKPYRMSWGQFSQSNILSQERVGSLSCHKKITDIFVLPYHIAYHTIKLSHFITFDRRKMKIKS